jgi:hypothetical protein
VGFSETCRPNRDRLGPLSENALFQPPQGRCKHGPGLLPTRFEFGWSGLAQFPSGAVLMLGLEFGPGPYKNTFELMRRKPRSPAPAKRKRILYCVLFGASSSVENLEYVPSFCIFKQDRID